MKDINLPITQTVSLTIDPNSMDMSNAVPQEDGGFLVPLGSMMDDDISAKMEQARVNGGKVLYATTSIEHQMESLLLQYFMGPFEGHHEPRDMFEREILQSSILSYKAKKDLLAKVIHELDLLQGKKKNRLQGKLKKVMDWRNAFAHGKVQHDTKDGCFIKYYAGGQQQLNLDDVFWASLEESFNECSELLKLAIDNVHKKAE